MTTKRKLTEMTRQRFDSLIAGIADNSLLEKWTDDYEPQNRADRVESRQLAALVCWVESGRSLEELRVMQWSRLEFWADGKDVSVELRRR